MPLIFNSRTFVKVKIVTIKVKPGKGDYRTPVVTCTKCYGSTIYLFNRKNLRLGPCGLVSCPDAKYWDDKAMFHDSAFYLHERRQECVFNE